MNAPLRRTYLDWLRGVAVLVMIEAHVFDSWTRYPDNTTREFGHAMILGGFGAPLFLFLAGVVVPLSAGSKLRRSMDVSAAWRVVARRGLQIFGLAILFRVQALILGWAHPRDLLKVDILNIMGPSMMLAALLWGSARTTAGRVAWLAGATVMTVLLTPFARTLPVLSALPDPIEAYIRPVGAMSNFVFFPWSAFVFAGAFIGIVLDDARTDAQERRANLTFATAGLVLAAAAYQASYFPSALPSWYPSTNFWTTSASFFFLRVGLLIAAVGAAWFWESRPLAADKPSPLRQLGRSSLFVYWIHVELVYGFFSIGLRKSTSWAGTWIAYAVFVVLMLACTIAKDRVVDWWKQGRVQRRTAASEVEAIRF
jgi:uncharacterized membrane protein